MGSYAAGVLPVTLTYTYSDTTLDDFPGFINLYNSNKNFITNPIQLSIYERNIVRIINIVFRGKFEPLPKIYLYIPKNKQIYDNTYAWSYQINLDQCNYY